MILLKCFRWAWLAFWGLLAAACVLLPLGALLWIQLSSAAKAAHQIRTVTFASAPGVIVRSRVVERDGVHIDLEYSYRVGDRQLTGRRLGREPSFLTSAEAETLTKSYPAGRRVMVYYDPAHPQDAVLRPGIDGSELLGLLAFVPFNLPLALLLVTAYEALQERIRPSSIAGIRVLCKGTTIRMLPSSGTPNAIPWELVPIGLAALGICVGPLFWVVADGSLPGRLAGIAWNVLVGASFLLCRQVQFWAAARLPSIDLSRRTLDLPGSGLSTGIPLEDIESIYVVLFQEPYTDWSRGTTLYASTYAPAIRYVDQYDRLAEHLLAQHRFRADAEALVECLHELLSIETGIRRGELEYVGPGTAC